MSLATKSQAIHPLPPDADAQSLVPANQDTPEPDFQNLITNPGFAEYLNKIADYATAQSNSDAQWERRRQTVQLRKYTLGQYYGIFDRTRGWTSAKEIGDGIYYSPETATFIDNLLKDLIKTKPEKKCEARNPERVDKREAARVAERLLKLDDDQDFTPKRQQREWKWNLLTAGETYRITYFNPQKSGCGVDEEVFEPVMIEGGEMASYCPLCNSTATDESGKCASCGNPQMDQFQSLGTTITVKKGSQFKQIGDVDYDVPDALEMTIVGDTDTIGEALIVMRDRMIPRCVLEDALGKTNLPVTDTPDNLHYKQLFDAHETSGSDLKEMELLHYQEFWVAPAVYTAYKMPESTPTQGGQAIPMNVSAKQIFPNGFYFTRVKKDICILFPQAGAECLSHTVNSIGEGFHGQGEWDLNELQDQATEAKSMKMNSMLLDSTQPLMMREGYVDKENFENKFGLVVPIGSEADSIDLDNIMGRVPAAKPPTEAYQLGDQIKGEMQQRVGAFSTQSDAPDIKAMGTATGMSAIIEQTLGRRAPALQLYSQMEVDQAYQKLEMRQKYWCKKMYDSVARDLGSDAVKWFMACNIRQDINISVVPNSWMPRTETQKQLGLQAFMGMTGELLLAKDDPKIIDEILRKANEVFGGGINFNDLETESIEAQLRLDKLREVGAFVENQFGEFLYDPLGNVIDEPIMLAFAQTAEMLRLNHTQKDERDIFATLPMDVMLDQHPEFEEAYSDWLKTAEGRAASPFIRTLVRELCEYHTQAKAFCAMKLAEYANIAALPDLEAELAVNEATHNQGMEQGAEAKEQELLYQGVAAAAMPQEQGSHEQAS